MPNWWERNRPVVRRKEAIVELEAKSAGYEAALRKAPWHMTGEALLSELDPRMIAFLTRLASNEVLVSPFNGEATPTENDRLRMVGWSRHWAIYDPLISTAIKLWTDYGFGQEISLTASEAEQQIWNAFWTAKRNRRILGVRHLQKLSNRILTDGELFFAVFIKKVGGEVTLRMFPTEQIVEIVTDPNDKDTVLYYKRAWTGPEGQEEKYYRDWLVTDEEIAQIERRSDVLPPGANRVDDEDDGLLVKIMHVSLEGFDDLRGWPLCVAAEPWAKAYKQFLTDRAAVARNVASVVDEYQVEGGQRVVDALQQQLQSSLNSTTGEYGETNPPPGAGSFRVQNKAVNVRRMPLTTAAGDAAQDSILLIGNAAAGMRLPVFMLGRTDMTQNRAIADAAMKPTLRAWGRYQGMWRSVFEDMYTIVCDAAATYGSLADNYDHEVVVSLASTVDVDFPDMVDALNALGEGGLVDMETLSSIALALPALGLSQDKIAATLDKMYPEDASPEDVPSDEEPSDEEPVEANYDIQRLSFLVEQLMARLAHDE